MIKVEDYEILENNRSSLKELSKDNHDGTRYYMTESSLSAIDFDRVKDEYIRDLKLKKVPRSNDAIYIDSDGRHLFIEFKNGYIENKDKFKIMEKIYDSLLIYTDIIGKGIEYTREQMDYILVYNEEKNQSRDEIGKVLSGLGGTSYIKFGLEFFEKYCFRKVHTYTEDEFEKFLNQGDGGAVL